MDKIFSISRNNQPTCLRLKNFRGKGNGTTDVDIEYDEVFLETAKKALKKTELSKGDLSNYIAGLIEKATMGIDGYAMEIEDEDDNSSGEDSGNPIVGSNHEKGT